MRLGFCVAGLVAAPLLLCACAAPRIAPLNTPPDVAQQVTPQARTNRTIARDTATGREHDTAERGRGDLAPIPDRPITQAAAWLKLAPYACNPKSNPGPTTAAWSGSCENGKPDGQGTYIVVWQTSQQLTLTGTFVNGVPEGHTTITYPEGDTYDGEFHGGLPNGHAVVKRADGTTITGELKDDVWTGKITMVGTDGTTAIGRFQHGLVEGTYYVQSVHGFRVEAQYRAGYPTGVKTIFFRNGATLETDASDAAKPVSASFADANGRRLKGRFEPSTFDASMPHRLAPVTIAGGETPPGAVDAWLMVGDDGRVVEAGVTTTKIDQTLIDAALAAMRGWNYAPATVDGHPVPSFRSVRIPLHWDKNRSTVTSAAVEEADTTAPIPRGPQHAGS